MTLDDEIAFLRSRIADLESALSLKDPTIQSVYKLTPGLTGLLGLLIELPFVSESIVQEKLKIASSCKVLMYRLRSELKARNIKVYSRRGMGWFIDDEIRERVRAAVTPEVSLQAA